MTREEAIKWLKIFKGCTGMAELSQAFDVAIKALEQEPYEDAISKEAVIKAVDKHTFDTDEGLCLDDDITCILEDLPPVQPKTKTGHWKRISFDKYVQHAQYYYRCSECGGDIIGEYNYCPNCGAKMVESQESEG